MREYLKNARLTFTWTDYLSWEKEICELLSEYVDDEVIAYFRLHPPKYVVCDNTSWLDNIVMTVKGFNVDVKHELSLLLTDHYEVFRAFHGCSPLDTATYYDQGIKRLNQSEYNQIAKEHFLSGNFPEIQESDLLAAIEDMETDNREGLVFFEAHEKMLLQCCGHYMLYGSEYLLGIAATLSKRDGIDYRRTLKQRGTPTVFVCDIPFKFIGFDTILELSGSIIETLFERILDPDYKHPQPGNCFGFPICHDLPPKYIVDHYHPDYVHDPIY